MAEWHPESGDYTVEDSGERAEFDSGMVRDTEEGKLDHNIIEYGPMKLRWIEHLNVARAKYPDVKPGIPNWTLAREIEEFARFLESAARHFDHWRDARMTEMIAWSLTGKYEAIPTPEDEAAAVFFNMNGVEFVILWQDIDEEDETLVDWPEAAPESFVFWPPGTTTQEDTPNPFDNDTYRALVKRQE